MSDTNEKKVYDPINLVEASGTVSSLGWSPYGHSIMMLSIIDSKDSTKTVNMEFAIESQQIPLRVGRQVKVKGYVRGFSGYNHIRKQHTHIQYCVAEQIDYPEPVMKRVFNKEGFFGDAGGAFTACFRGRVINVIETKGSPWVTLVLRTGSYGVDQRPCDVRVRCNKTWFHNIDTQFRRNDIIEAVTTASIFERTRADDGRVVRSESLTVREYCFVERGEKEAEKPHVPRFAQVDESVTEHDIAVLDKEGNVTDLNPDSEPDTNTSVDQSEGSIAVMNGEAEPAFDRQPGSLDKDDNADPDGNDNWGASDEDDGTWEGGDDDDDDDVSPLN